MGSTYEVKFVGGHDIATVRAIVEEELAAFDATFSNWREDSEIARCNRHHGTEPFPVSARFAAVLAQALEIAAATDGVAAAHARVGWRRIELHGDPRTAAVHKLQPDVELDLDGIVAGACADAVAARLEAAGVHDVYLQITGEVLCRGEKAPGVPWQIGVVDPASDAWGGDVAVRTLPLRDRALCTSGDYRNAFDAGGRRVHHVFDPRTGRSAESGIVSASVLAASAAVADALGTAFLVMGEEGVRERLPALRRQYDVGVLLLVAAAGDRLTPVEFAWPQ
jgi:thiamine biosynthesis lipoprotein